jgi:hypothetical protein
VQEAQLLIVAGVGLGNASAEHFVALPRPPKMWPGWLVTSPFPRPGRWAGGRAPVYPRLRAKRKVAALGRRVAALGPAGAFGRPSCRPSAYGFEHLQHTMTRWFASGTGS